MGAGQGEAEERVWVQEMMPREPALEHKRLKAQSSKLKAEGKECSKLEAVRAFPLSFEL
jgi:hypothetical protein